MKYKGYLLDFLKLSIPVTLGQVGAVLMGLTDMVMLGQVGKDEIAAVGIANQVYFLFMVFGLGMMAALSSLVSTSKGANQNKECGELLRTGIELSFLVSLVLCVLLFLISENFYLFNQPEEINKIAIPYLRLLNVSTIPYLLFVSLKQYSDGLHFTKPAMYITLITVVINALLNAVFIYGWFSFPASGAFGAGVATLFARIFMAFAFVLYIFKTSIYKEFLPNLVSTFRTQPVIVKLLKVGIPSGAQMFLEISAFTGTAIFVGWLGVNYLAAHQILLGILALIYTSAVGFSVAGSIKVAHSRGMGYIHGVKFWSVFTFLMVFTVLLAACFALYIFDEQIIGLFVQEAEVFAIASSTFLFMVIFLLIDGLQVTGIGLLRSVEDVKFPTYVTLGSYLILGLPLSYLFAFIFEYSIWGVWFGLIAGGIISSAVLGVRFFILVKNIKFKKYEEINLNAN